MFTQTPSALQIAKFFIQQYIAELQQGVDNKLTNLKLQKILYYAQGWYLAFKNKSLFEEHIEAWQYGPVVPSVYHQYKNYGNRPLSDVAVSDADFKDLTVDTKDFLMDIWNIYKKYSGSDLILSTHLETPYIEALKPRFNLPLLEISKNSMQEYFGKKIKDGYQ